MKIRLWKDCWPLYLFIIGGIAMLCVMQGCKSFDIFGIIKHGGAPRGNGHSPDVSTLNYMALIAFIPGVILTTIGFAIFPPLKNVGGILLGIGLGTAVLAVLIKAYATWIILCGLGACAAVFIIWIVGHRRKIMRGKLGDIV